MRFVTVAVLACTLAGIASAAGQNCTGYTSLQHTYIEASEELVSLKQTSPASCCSTCTTVDGCEVWAYCGGPRYCVFATGSCPGGDGSNMAEGTCMLSFSPGNETMLSLQVAARLDWTSGISNQSIGATAVVAATTPQCTLPSGDSSGVVAGGNCSYENNTLYNHIEDTSVLSPQPRLDVARGIMSAQECCEYCKSKPPCNTWSYCLAHAPKNYASCDWFTYGTEKEYFGTLYSSLEPGYCILYKDPNLHSMVLDRVWSRADYSPWVSGWIGPETP